MISRCYRPAVQKKSGGLEIIVVAGSIVVGFCVGVLAIDLLEFFTGWHIIHGGIR